MQVIEELKPKRAFLTHLSHEFDHNSYEERLPDHIRLAYDGLRIDF
jgi:phosphoribosyl 1,2-cyclic phosphate phosphodiesterase